MCVWGGELLTGGGGDAPELALVDGELVHLTEGGLALALPPRPTRRVTAAPVTPAQREPPSPPLRTLTSGCWGSVARAL